MTHDGLFNRFFFPMRIRVPILHTGVLLCRHVYQLVVFEIYVETAGDNALLPNMLNVVIFYCSKIDSCIPNLEKRILTRNGNNKMRFFFLL